MSRGKVREAAVLDDLGLEKNTKSLSGVDPKTGLPGSTIPDAIDPKTGDLIEIKDKVYTTNSKQLRIQGNVAEKKVVKQRVIVGTDAKVSKTVEKLYRPERSPRLGPKIAD